MVLYIIRVTRATGTTSFLLLFLSLLLLLLHFLYSFEEVRTPCARTWTSLRRHRQTNRERQLFSSSFCCHRRRRCCSQSLLFVPSREKEKATSFFSSMLPTPRCSCSSKTAKLKSVASMDLRNSSSASTLVLSAFADCFEILATSALEPLARGKDQSEGVKVNVVSLANS